ncbi:MAG: hypothetical protein JWO03_12 [Bacteroidetes bacterium]|nr:hypothetical protein [Bacteroidota bacterium]
MKYGSLLLYIMLCFCLSSCRSDSYKSSASQDFEPVACLDINHKALNDRQWQAIKAAASDVCGIFHSSEFQSRLNNKLWLASCEKVKGKPDSVTGPEIYKLLTEKRQRFCIYARKLHDAEGETDNDDNNPNNNRISIDPALIEGWYSPIDTQRSQLINVIAHEYVHLLSDRFLDYDDNAPTGCSDDILISYNTGDIAEAIWLDKHRRK